MADGLGDLADRDASLGRGVYLCAGRAFSSASGPPVGALVDLAGRARIPGDLDQHRDEASLVSAAVGHRRDRDQDGAHVEFLPSGYCAHAPRITDGPSERKVRLRLSGS